MSSVASWLDIATDRSVRTRALFTCVLVGTILTGVTVLAGVARGGGLAIEPWQVGLMYLVPFLVSTASSVHAIRAQRSGSATSRLLLEREIDAIGRFPGENPNPVLRIGRDGTLRYRNPASDPIAAAFDLRVGEPIPGELLADLEGAAGGDPRRTVEVVAGHRTYALLPVRVDELDALNVYGTDVTAERAVRRFPEGNPNPVLRLGPDGTLEYGNPASHRLRTGLGLEIGAPLASPLREELLAAAAGQVAQAVELTTEHRTYALLPVPVPEFGFVNVYGTDITAERAVRRFPDSNPNPVMRMGPEGTLEYTNAAARPIAEALGIEVGQALPTELVARLEAARADDGSVEVEGAGRTYALRPVLVPEFGFTNLYGTDITASKALDKFPNQNPNPVLRVAADGALRYANPASDPILRQLGLAVGEPLPGSLLERLRAANGGTGPRVIEVEAEGDVYELLPVSVFEFGFINIYGTDVTATREVERANRENERLLLNILPASIASRLRKGETVIADRIEEMSVLFADVVGFTAMAARLSPNELVEMLNEVFSLFDHLADDFGLEKIKTIGDAYMVAGGLTEPGVDHAERVASMGLEMLAAVGRLGGPWAGRIQIRVGMHTGPTVAGVIGIRKFIYDIWGDTVNTASRMESLGEPGRFQVTPATRARLEGTFVFETRGTIEVKGIGPIETSWLVGRAPAASPALRRRRPSGGA